MSNFEVKDKHFRIGRALLLFFVILFTFWGMYQLSFIFNPLLIALLVTYISDPIITRLEKVFKHRLIAVSAIYIYLILLFVLVPIIVMGRLYSESQSLYVTLVGERSTDLNNNKTWDKGEHFTDLNNDKKGQPGELFFDLNHNRKYDRSEDAHFYKLIEQAEKYAASVDKDTMGHVARAIDLDKVVAYLKANVKNIASMGGKVTKWLFTTISSSAKSVFDIISLFILVPLYTFFFLYEWNDIKSSIKKYLPAFYKDRIIDIVCKVDKAVSSFFRGRLIICILKSLIIGLGLWICGIRFSMFIGLLAGFMSIIPMFGPIIGSIPAFTFVVIDHHSSSSVFIAVIAVFLIAEFIEGVFLQPYILGSETGLHPITLIVSFMVFGKIFGTFGLLLAVPLMAIVKILGIEFLLPMVEEFAEPQDEEKIDNSDSDTKVDATKVDATKTDTTKTDAAEAKSHSKKSKSKKKS